MMRLRRRLDGVDSDLGITVGAVLEPDRTRNSGSKLTVNLAFGSTRADGAPGHQIGNVLRRDHVKKLADRRQAKLIDLYQQFTCRTQALVDIEATVQARLVDQPFPAHRGAALLELHPNHYFQLALEVIALFKSTLGLLVDGNGIIFGAWHNHSDTTVVAPVTVVGQIMERAEQQILERA